MADKLIRGFPIIAFRNYDTPLTGYLKLLPSNEIFV